MIQGQLIAPGQLTDPGVNFASVHRRQPVTVHISFSLPRRKFWRRVPVVQQQVTRLSEVLFLHVNRTQTLPRGNIALRMLIINVWNKFPNKKFQKTPEIGKRV